MIKRANSSNFLSSLLRSFDFLFRRRIIKAGFVRRDIMKSRVAIFWERIKIDLSGDFDAGIKNDRGFSD